MPVATAAAAAIARVKCPVPQPTSSTRSAGETLANCTNAGARRRLPRPTYPSYASGSVATNVAMSAPRPAIRIPGHSTLDSGDAPLGGLLPIACLLPPHVHELPTPRQQFGQLIRIG